MKMKERLMNGLAKVKTEATACSTALMVAMATNPTVSATMNSGAADKMVKLLNVIVPYIAVIGIPLAAVGAFKLIQAFRNDQGDQIPSAARDLAIGILLVLFPAIWSVIADVVGK